MVETFVVTIKDLYVAGNAFSKVLNFPMEAKSAYWLNKSLKKVVSELRKTEDERQRIVGKYNPQIFELQKQFKKLREAKDDLAIENLTTAIKGFEKAREDEWQNFISGEVELTMKKLDLDIIKDVKLAAVDMEALEKFISEPAEEQR